VLEPIGVNPEGRDPQILGWEVRRGVVDGSRNIIIAYFAQKVFDFMLFCTESMLKVVCFQGKETN